MSADASTLRAAGWLLLAGGALAIIGAFLPPHRQWTSPLEEGLRVIDANPVGWRLIHAGFAAGTVLAAMGLALVAYALRGQPAGPVALAVACAFGAAGVFWLSSIAVRLSATPWAARELVAGGTVPNGYAAWRAFGGALYVAFVALGYLSIAGTGWLVRAASLGPSWLGWLIVAWGLSGGFIVGTTVPVILYVPLAVLGGLLVRSG